jgi:Asp-tRNA(Asn)/Glu-tRNA(Gln) amidotransferase C subunit
MARTKAVAVLGEIAKDLRPKDLMGLKGHGGEPKISEQPAEDKRSSMLGRAFNWYNYFCTNKEAKQFIVDYLTQTGDTVTAKKLNRVSDGKVVATYGWLARFSQRGYQLSEEEKTKLYKEVNRLINLEQKSEQPETSEVEETQEETQEETNKRNVQVVMRERAQDISGEILGLVDDYVKEGCKTAADTTTKVVNMLSEKNILPQHISIVLQPFDAMKQELLEVQKGEDEQLVEGYSHLGKVQVKNLIKFIEQITSNINSYVALKQTTKAKRARKPISVEKQVSKLKYLRKFVDEKAKLNLVSIEPTKLHNSSECWVYDTAKRKLYHFVADELGKCLIVKGNTLLGFDTKESEAKILRKPEEQLKQIMGSKPAARKFFKEIKAVATTPNGRFNAAMIILKAF